MLTRRRFGELVSAAFAAIVARPPFADERRVIGFAYEMSPQARDNRLIVSYDDGSTVTYIRPVFTNYTLSGSSGGPLTLKFDDFMAFDADGRMKRLNQLSYDAAGGWNL